MQEDERGNETQALRDIKILVRAAVEGNRSSFEQLVEIHQGGIFRMVYARVQSRTDAEDLVQDVFLKAYGSLSSLRDPVLFKAWLYRIAVNKVKDFRRRQRFASLFSFAEEGKEQDHPDMRPDSYDHLAGKQFWTRFNEFIGKLPRLQQEVFRLRFLDHLSIAEIALTLERSESAVKTHLYRAIEKFKNEGFSLGTEPEEAS
jgi:RNA polymerase sigma-70 factor (ECF subfamily)